MSERCKCCEKMFSSGVWLTSQFDNEGVLLFCSEECKIKHLKERLERIRLEYPSYYEGLVKRGDNGMFREILDSGESKEEDLKGGNFMDITH